MKKILPIFLLIIFSCSNIGGVKKFPIYGNYCGMGNPRIIQELPPINAIDFLCQERIFCQRKNYKNQRVCDDILAAEMKKIKATNEIEKSVRSSIITYFDK